MLTSNSKMQQRVQLQYRFLPTVMKEMSLRRMSDIKINSKNQSIRDFSRFSNNFTCFMCQCTAFVGRAFNITIMSSFDRRIIHTLSFQCSAKIKPPTFTHTQAHVLAFMKDLEEHKLIIFSRLIPRSVRMLPCFRSESWIPGDALTSCEASMNSQRRGMNFKVKDKILLNKKKSARNYFAIVRNKFCGNIFSNQYLPRLVDLNNLFKR